MSRRALVCLPDDDRMHPNTGEPTFNESAYFNFYDPAERLGGFLRLGNRPNEGYAEMTLCLYLPDDRVAFMFKRPQIATNDAHAAGGMRFVTVEPMRAHRLTYAGSCLLLSRPLDLLDPKAAFAAGPYGRAEVSLDYEALCPVVGGEPREERDGVWVSVRAEKPGQEFARGHLEQHGRATGTVRVDERTWRIEGFGLRDRSWGPRTWQAPDHYRWLTMSFGADAGIAAAVTVQRDGRRVQGGYVFEPGTATRLVSTVEVDSQFDAQEKLHTGLTARLGLADGTSVEVRGRVLAMVPLRNRRDGATTRIAEGLTEWRWGDRVGYGWSEYLDHV
jgi:hypothetical protein